MNAELLHDALTLLPEDLIAETDALRQAKKPRVIPWKRILPLAACLCLILLTTPAMVALMAPKGAKEMAMDYAAPAEAAPAPAAAEEEAAMEDALLDFPAEETLKAGAAMKDAPPDSGAGADRSAVFDNAAAYPLTARYLPPQPSDIEGGQSITVISTREALDAYLADNNADASLQAACEGYDERYFADRQLVLLQTAVYRPAAGYSGNILLPLQSGSWVAEKTDDHRWILRVQDMDYDISSHDAVRQHILLEVPGRLISQEDAIEWAAENRSE